MWTLEGIAKELRQVPGTYEPSLLVDRENVKVISVDYRNGDNQRCSMEFALTPNTVVSCIPFDSYCHYTELTNYDVASFIRAELLDAFEYGLGVA